MPRIEPYEQRTGATTALGNVPRISSGGEGLAALGQALTSVAEDRLRLQAFERQKAEEQDAVNAQLALASEKSFWAEDLQRREQNAPEDGSGHVESVLKDFDQRSEELLKTAATERGRNYLKARLAEYRLALQNEALAFETRKGAEFKVRGLETAVDRARIAAEFRPADFEELMADQLEAIQASGLPLDVQAKLATAAEQSLASAAVQGIIRHDPQVALSELNNERSENAAIRALSFEQRQALRRAAETEIRQREAEQRARLTEARQAMDDRLSDIQAAARLGIPVTDVPSESLLKSLYGEHEGAQRYKIAQQAAELSVTVAGMHQRPTQALIEEVVRAQPTQVEGAADQAKLHAFIAGRVSDIVKAREQDAAGYLTQFSPAVRDAWNALQADTSPEVTQRYLAAVRAEKERLGIVSQDVLPRAYVSTVANDIASAKTAESLVDRLEAETLRWGDAWPEVLGQLNEHISGIAMVIGSGLPRPAAVALASTMNLKDAELKALLPPDVKWSDVQAEIDSQFLNFQRSFPAEAAGTWNAVRAAATRLAVQYMHAGSGQGEAVKRAYADLVESQYTVREVRGSVLRIPAGLDADKVEVGARVALESFSPDSATVFLPPGAALPAEEYAAQFGVYVREHAYWVTSPDGKGLRLYVDGGPVINVNGPVSLGWEELTALGDDEIARRAREFAARLERAK